LRPTAHHFEGFERGLYSRSTSRRVYASLRRQALRWLRRGHSVVLDATYGRPAERAALRQLVRRAGVRLVVLICRADETVLRSRLAARTQDADSTSDARLELWPRLKAAFIEPAELSGAISIDATQPLEQQLDHAIAALRNGESVSRAAAA